jgi:hypothetical protein
MISDDSEDRKIRAWQKDVVSSIADSAPATPCDPAPTVLRQPAPLVVNQIVTTPRVIVTRAAAPEPKHSDEISTKAIIGTFVGATAGAFIAYAMVKGDSANRQQLPSAQRITYRTIEVPAEYEGRHFSSTTRVPIQATHTHYGSFADGNPGTRALTIGPPPPRVETLLASSAHLHNTAYSNPQKFQVASQRSPIVMIDNDARSRVSSGRKTIRQEGTANPPPSAHVTVVRSARDVPLPAHSQASQYSRATSTTVNNRANTKAPKIEPRENLLPSIAPHDSISQVSTNKSRDGTRSKHRSSSHHGRSQTGSRSQKNDGGREASKAGSKYHSKVGNMVEDVVSVIRGTSIKDNEHRRRH